MKCLTGWRLCVDRCSYIDIYNSKVADCKHQVTAMLEAFSVYYSIPFNHRGWEFTGCWCHFSLPAGDGGGCGDGTVSGLTSLHAEVFLRPVTGPALLIRGPVVDVTLRFDQRYAAVFLLFFPQHKCPPFFCLASIKEQNRNSKNRYFQATQLTMTYLF